MSFNYTHYLGLTYHPRGRGEKGYDCWGLPIYFYDREFNIQLEDRSYEENWWKTSDSLMHDGLQNRENGFVPLPRNPFDWQLGDILTFTVHHSEGKANHAGIWIPDGHKVLHIEVGTLSVCEPYCRRLYHVFVGAYRHVKRL